MSDEYGQVGPDKPGYARDLDELGAHIVSGTAVDVLFAARSTAKHIVITTMYSPTLFYGPHPPGFRTDFAHRGLFVGIVEGQAAWLPYQQLHWSYVAGYLGQPFGDSDEHHPLADFLNELLERLGVAPVQSGMRHAGTFSVRDGRPLIEHAAGLFAHDPAGDNCPLCLDPKGCPRNAHSSGDCVRRRDSVTGDAEWQVVARMAPCPVHDPVGVR